MNELEKMLKNKKRNTTNDVVMDSVDDNGNGAITLNTARLQLPADFIAQQQGIKQNEYDPFLIGILIFSICFIIFITILIYFTPNK